MAHLPGWHKSTPISIRHPQNPFLRMQAAIDDLMEDFYHEFGMPSVRAEEFEKLMINPAIDIIEDKDHFKVEAEMPGMGEEDIQISIDNGILTIKGEKQTSKKDRDKNYIMREISYGSYERSIRLPETADVDKAKASFKKGMLWIDIPKKPGASKQSQQLKIEKA